MPLPLTDPRPAPPNRSVRVAFEGHFGGAAWANVMWLYLTGSGTITSSDLLILADKCNGAYASFLQWMSNQAELQRVQVILYENGENREGVSGTVRPGLATGGTLLPANVAACVTWNIAPVYRGGHPRTYIAGALSSYQAAVNTWTTAAQTQLKNRADDFHTALEQMGPIGGGIATVEHGIISFQRAKQWRTPPVFYRINGASVDVRIDSQRRRLGRDL